MPYGVGCAASSFFTCLCVCFLEFFVHVLFEFLIWMYYLIEIHITLGRGRDQHRSEPGAPDCADGLAAGVYLGASAAVWDQPPRRRGGARM